MGRHLLSLLLYMAGTISPSTAIRHIVFIVADDLGWNDVGFHNPDIISPNIDRLASQGVILNQSYVQPMCTPSRHAFMTGQYPFKAGRQRHVIQTQKAECSPLNLEFLPQKLKKLNYTTHMVGKWHLGFCSWNCTPTYRGFDTFLGYYIGYEDYYTKYKQNGRDFRENEKPALSTTYSAEVYAERAVDIINKHNKSVPLFLYLPFQSVHMPVQVPKRFESMYPTILNQQRRQYSGMVTALDEAIGNVTTALQTAGLTNDTLIIFTSDNGGNPKYGGNNYPLRGTKGTVYEGGTRAAAFVYGAGLEKKGYTYDGLMHVVDWHPTILAAAEAPNVTSIDGINQWDAIRTGAQSNRLEFVYNLDDNHDAPERSQVAIRVNDYKLIQGSPGRNSDWYPPPTNSDVGQSQVGSQQSGRRFLLESMTEQLYDIRSDPNERNDISKDYPDIVKKLSAKLDEYRKTVVHPKQLPDDPASSPSNFGGYWSPGWCNI